MGVDADGRRVVEQINPEIREGVLHLLAARIMHPRVHTCKITMNAFDGPPRRVDVADEPVFSGALQRCGLEGRRRPSQAAAAASARNGDPGEYGRAAERNEDGLECTSFDDARLVLG